MEYLDIIDEVRNYTVDGADADTRLDHYLVRCAADFSRSFLKKLIDNGLVLVNDVISKPGYKLRAGDVITLNIPKPVSMEAVPENIPLDILYEDSDIIVINKRPGMVVHSAPGHESGTLVNALLYHCGDLSGIGGELRPGIVHRLDMDTSGCIVCAKSDVAHRALSEQFSSRTVSKKYLAITHNTPVPPEGKVEGYILRQPQDWQRRVFFHESSDGKYSLTFYRTLGAARGISLVECVIKTGRTHQIRLHMKALHCPILCDNLYGKESKLTPGEISGVHDNDDASPIISRQALHAGYLSFVHPLQGTMMEFTAPLPEDMLQVLAVAGIKDYNHIHNG